MINSYCLLAVLLQGEPVRIVIRALDAVSSTYAKSFAQLCQEVFAARSEANDNVRYLSPLRTWFEKLEVLDGPFESLVQVVCVHALLCFSRHSPDLFFYPSHHLFSALPTNHARPVECVEVFEVLQHASPSGDDRSGNVQLHHKSGVSVHP